MTNAKFVSDLHTHRDETGSLVKCYHKTKVLFLSWEFWFASFVGFPIEHAIWELSPLRHLTHWLGM
jgi:hypothetical protein